MDAKVSIPNFLDQGLWIDWTEYCILSQSKNYVTQSIK